VSSSIPHPADDFAKKAERLTETLLADGTCSDVDVVRTVGPRDAYIAAAITRTGI
jgi:hypothetical protein